VQRAARFLAACQNPDGGFGERAEAYREPARAGRGPSMPAVTGFVLLGLLAAAPAANAALLRGAARFLIATQDASGSWGNADWLHTVNPPDSFYTYDLPAKALPLLALSRYRELVEWSSPLP
jgi:squalene-hopene/tetraprenyl-beta-curcumene cyclase